MKNIKILLPFLLLSFSINVFSQVNDSIEIQLYKNNVKKEIKKATITFFLVEGTITNDIIDNKFAFPEIDFDKNDSIAFIIDYKNYLFCKNTYYYKSFDAKNEKNNYWDVYYFDNIKKLIASGQHSYGLETKEKYVVIHWNYNHLCLYGTGNVNQLISKRAFSHFRFIQKKNYITSINGYDIYFFNKNIPRYLKDYINQSSSKHLKFKNSNFKRKSNRKRFRKLNYYMESDEFCLLSYDITGCRNNEKRLVLFEKEDNSSIKSHHFILGNNSIAYFDIIIQMIISKEIDITNHDIKTF